ncbi:MAG TPA: hypothetical protein VGM94_12155 [Galbitalea sp.]|jgi:hypothetical protein
MTTFQDPPPQSRRAVRQSERGENPEQVPAEQSTAEPTSAPRYSFDAEGKEQQAAADQPVQPHMTGRRAQLPAPLPDPAAAGFEPLTYVTQGRVPLPADHLPTPEPARTPAQPPAEQRLAPPPTDDYTQGSLATSPPPGEPDQPGFRVRDFSPEGRRAAISREQFAGVSQAPAPSFAPPVAPVQPVQAVPPVQPVSSAPLTAPVDLDYHTQGAAPATGSHAARPPQSDDPAADHTLTRRELRELRAAQEAAAPPLALPETIDSILNSGPIELPTLAPPPGQSQALADAMAEFDSLTKARREAEAAARDAQVATLSAPAPVTSPISAAPPPPGGAVSAGFAPPAPVDAPETEHETVANEADANEADANEGDAAGEGDIEPVVEQAAVEHAAVEHPATEQPVAALVEPPVPAPVSLENGLPAPIFFDEPEPTPAVQPFGLATTPDVFAQAPLQGAGSVPSAVSAPSAPAPSETSAPAAAAPPAPTDHAVLIAPPAGLQPEIDQLPSTPAPVSVEPVFLEPETERVPSARPTGHWSVQAEQEDDGLPSENTLSRTVGTGTSAITTSALVLPSVPQSTDLTRPLTATGEILVTGSIDLPRSLGSTGAHPHRVDNSDFEDDPLDSEVASPDSAPVRAIRAVSTHTSTRGVIESKKPQSNRLLTIGIAAASVLVVGVVGLLVWALATGQFNS